MIQRLVDTRQPERVLDVLEPFLENLRIALLDDTATAENHDTSLRQEIENSEKNTSNTSNDREEVRRLRELVRVLEQQVAKQESMIRLQQSKIDALVAMIDDDTTGGSHGVVKWIDNVIVIFSTIASGLNKFSAILNFENVQGFCNNGI